MDMVTRYLESKKPRPEQAHQIPGLAVNFFDQQGTFQDGFTPNEQKGDPTHFTATAQDYFSTELKQIVTPDNFQPTEEGVSLHRYNPSQPYYNPGAGK